MHLTQGRSLREVYNDTPQPAAASIREIKSMAPTKAAEISKAEIVVPSYEQYQDNSGGGSFRRSAGKPAGPPGSKRRGRRRETITPGRPRCRDRPGAV